MSASNTIRARRTSPAAAVVRRVSASRAARSSTLSVTTRALRGPDITRRIFPVVQVITADGGRRMPDAEVAAIADRVIAGRMNRPDGPAAPLESGDNR